MAGTTAAGFLAVGLLAACTASAAAQAVPIEGGPFNDLTEKQLSFQLPPGVDIAHRNFVGKSPLDSAGYKAANVQNIFLSLEPCNLFAPHLHPNATEIAVGAAGTMDIYVLLNGKLLHQAMKPLNVQIIPKGHVHFLINNRCKQAIIASTETAAIPGACFYFDVPSPLLRNQPTAADVQQLVATHTSNCSGKATKAFNKLQNDCAARCGLLPKAPAAPTPTYKFVKTPAPSTAKAAAPSTSEYSMPSTGNGY